jgi:transposase-like protein
MANPLTKVQRATARRSEANASWRTAIRQAHSEGASLRQIAAAAGVSHVRILQIVRQRENAPS